MLHLSSRQLGRATAMRSGFRSLSTEVSTYPPPREKRTKIVVLGTGWASFALVKKIDVNKADVTVISPRNHFLFTPLLASTTIGTLEFRSIVEPIRDTTGVKDMKFHYASANEIDIEKKLVHCNSVYGDGKTPFSVEYDKLVIGIGVVPGTFGIPGVREHALFLKELHHARKVRQRILSCFEMARNPSTPDDKKRQILHFVIVGGGPTGVEFAAELGDFFRQDIPRLYPHLDRSMIKITLLEAGQSILTAFDKKLAQRAMRNFSRLGITIRTDSMVKEVTEDEIHLSSGEVLPYGACIWSAGIQPRDVVEKLPLQKDKGHRLVTDHSLRAIDQSDVYVIGDCGTIIDQPYPATAQVASQQGAYLARAIFEHDPQPWKYHHFGILAYVGDYKSLFDTDYVKQSGFLAWLAWRSAYLTKLGSWKNKMQVPLDWLKSLLWGRDITLF